MHTFKKSIKIVLIILCLSLSAYFVIHAQKALAYIAADGGPDESGESPSDGENEDDKENPQPADPPQDSASTKPANPLHSDGPTPGAAGTQANSENTAPEGPPTSAPATGGTTTEIEGTFATTDEVPEPDQMAAQAVNDLLSSPTIDPQYGTTYNNSVYNAASAAYDTWEMNHPGFDNFFDGAIPTSAASQVYHDLMASDFSNYGISDWGLQQGFKELESMLNENPNALNIYPAGTYSTPDMLNAANVAAIAQLGLQYNPLVTGMTQPISDFTNSFNPYGWGNAIAHTWIGTNGASLMAIDTTGLNPTEMQDALINEGTNAGLVSLKDLLDNKISTQGYDSLTDAEKAAYSAIQISQWSSTRTMIAKSLPGEVEYMNDLQEVLSNYNESNFVNRTTTHLMNDGMSETEARAMAEHFANSPALHDWNQAINEASRGFLW
jgi:hypothetical protein